MKRILACATLLAFAASCSTVRKVEVPTALEEAPPEGAPVGRPLRIAVLRQEPPPPPPTAKKPTTTPAKPVPPPPPGTRVAYSPTYAEEYPSTAHMLATVPMALREAGFDVVEVRSPSEARTQRAVLTLELLPPEIEGFRSASGRTMTAGGSSYDVHVFYRGKLSSTSGTMGLVSGHGESSTHFAFADPFVETAAVGAVSLSVMTLAALGVALPLVAFLAYRANANASDPLGYCTPENVKPPPSNVAGGNAAPAPNAPSPVALCGQVAWLAAEVAVVAAVIAVAGAALGVTEFLGHRVFGGGRGFIRSLVTERTWRGMVKAAHDRAARSLAVAVVQASGRLPPTEATGGVR